MNTSDFAGLTDNLPLSYETKDAWQNKMRPSPFDNLEQLGSSIAAQQPSYAQQQIKQENQQRRKRYQHMNSHAMGTFARVDLMLNKLRDKRYGS